MKQLINNFQKMISAPLLIIPHHVLEYAVHLFHDLEIHELCKFDFARLNNDSYDLNSEGVKFGIIDLKVLEKDLN